jgi:hypothetical protein
MDQSTKFETVDVAELLTIDGGLLFDDRVVIIGCTPPFPPLQPGQIPWNPWIGQPYPTRF